MLTAHCRKLLHRHLCQMPITMSQLIAAVKLFASPPRLCAETSSQMLPLPTSQDVIKHMSRCDCLRRLEPERVFSAIQPKLWQHHLPSFPPSRRTTPRTTAAMPSCVLKLHITFHPIHKQHFFLNIFIYLYHLPSVNRFYANRIPVAICISSTHRLGPFS